MSVIKAGETAYINAFRMIAGARPSETSVYPDVSAGGKVI
jgi:hypothetical protein